MKIIFSEEDLKNILIDFANRCFDGRFNRADLGTYSYIGPEGVTVHFEELKAIEEIKDDISL